jgi:hypothetical protein
MTVRMADENGFTIRRRDELERSGRWLLVRRSIGLKSFGMNVVEIEAGDRIPSTTRPSATKRRSSSSSPATRR